MSNLIIFSPYAYCKHVFIVISEMGETHDEIEKFIAAIEEEAMGEM
jgi:hypothetical protein